MGADRPRGWELTSLHVVLHESCTLIHRGRDVGDADGVAVAEWID